MQVFSRCVSIHNAIRSSLPIIPTGICPASKCCRLEWSFSRYAREPPPALVLPDGPLAGENDPGVPKDYLTQNLIGHFHYMLGVSFETRDWSRARREFDAAARAAPSNDVLFYNLGLIYQRNGLLDDAAAAFERSQAINPRHLPSGTRPRAADRLAELAVLRTQKRARKLDASARDPVSSTPRSEHQ